MIISKKKFNEEIEKAVYKAVEEDRSRRWLDDRICDIEKRLDRRTERIETKIMHLEDAIFPQKEDKEAYLKNVNIDRWKNLKEGVRYE